MQITPDVVKNPTQLMLALKSILADLEALKTASDGANDGINALKTDHNTLIAKLNLDAGVTDTNYATSTATVPSDVSLVTE